MIAQQIDAEWWFYLNGLLRRSMVRGVPGLGPPKIVLTEYPKSGGTWVTQMVAEYLGVTNPRNRLPPRRRCVIHGHYLRVADRHDTVVVWRDGRDVMVSYYCWIFLVQAPRRYLKRLRILEIEDPLDVERYLPRFIEYSFSEGLPRGLTWTNFAEKWRQAAGCLETSYEAMSEDPQLELSKILGPLSVDGIDQERLEACIAKYSFENVTGRKRGQEDVRSFVRKGVVGDWKSKFSREARQVFDHYAGQALIDLGYEDDRSWVSGSSQASRSDSG